MTEQLSDNGEVPLRDRPIPEIATILQRTLGYGLFAYTIGMDEKHPHVGALYASGKQTPSEVTASTFRDLAEVVEFGLEKEGSADAVLTVMIGANPVFEDRSPAELFASGEGDKVVAAGAAVFS